MKIYIKESELREMVKQTVNDWLNLPEIYGGFDKAIRYNLTEGLTMTYSVNKMVGILNRKYDFNSLKTKLSHFDDNSNSKNMSAPFHNNSSTTRDNDNWYNISIYFQFGVKDNADIVYNIIHTCDACGWFLSDCTYYTRNGMEQNINVKNDKSVDFYDEKLKSIPVKIVFRAKFNAEYKQKSIPPYLYHICPTRVVNKILRQGLTPRNNGRIASHPERVYLFLDKNNDWEDIASQFRISGNDEPYSYLRVDTREINPQIHFYYDSNVMQGNPAIYTLEPIPPTAIKVIDQQNN